MPGKIPENILEDILSRVDIVGIISSYLPLKKAGRNFKANCPFHHEKTPSFMVSPDKQIYHCFGCGESGNAFKFLMRHERMDFPEAVSYLAKKVGVLLPEIEKPDNRAADLSTALYRINELAAAFYENNLNSSAGSQAKEYLTGRKVNPHTLKEFKLGFALDQWDSLLNYLRSKNVPLSLIEKSGLILARDNGGYYDRFRNRIIFPIIDLRGRVAGFGARVMDKSLPKYINSPETPVYVKGRNLYGFNLSKNCIRENDCAIIVEGYLDFIMPYQEGIKNIVASQGTALTLEQVRLLKRYTSNVIVIYDGDTAGELATLRSLDILIEEGLNVKIVTLAQGFDPDLFVRKEGAQRLKKEIEEAKNLFDYKLKVMKSRHNTQEPQGKGAVVFEMLSTINKFQNAVIRGEYIRLLAEGLGTHEPYILEELRKMKSQERALPQANLESKKKPEIDPLEKLLIKFMMEEKEFFDRIRLELAPEDFQDERTSKIVSVVYELFRQGKNIGVNQMMNYFHEDDAMQLVCESMFLPELSMEEKERAVGDCIKRLKSRRSKSKREDLHFQIKQAQNSGDEEKLNSLVQEFHSLIKKG